MAQLFSIHPNHQTCLLRTRFLPYRARIPSMSVEGNARPAMLPQIAETAKHPITLILLDQSTIKDVRFSVHKTFWAGYPFFDGLPVRVHGTLNQWGLTGVTPWITWDDGGRDTKITLSELLSPASEFKFELYKDGRSAPKVNARRAAAAGATAAATANAAAAAGTATRRSVDVPYTDGGRDLVQTWYYETPHAIYTDARQDARQRPKFNRNPDQYQTPFDMWTNCCLPMTFIERMFAKGDPTATPPVPAGFFMSFIPIV